MRLAAHQMSGFDAVRARALLSIPHEFHPVTVVAVVWAAQPEDLPNDSLRQRELAPRSGRQISEFAFAEQWPAPEWQAIPEETDRELPTQHPSTGGGRPEGSLRNRRI